MISLQWPLFCPGGQSIYSQYFLTFLQQQWQQWPLSAFQLPCDITPLPRHNGHLSTTATFLCPQSGCCEDQARLYSLKFVGNIFTGE